MVTLRESNDRAKTGIGGVCIIGLVGKKILIPSRVDSMGKVAGVLKSRRVGCLR